MIAQTMVRIEKLTSTGGLLGQVDIHCEEAILDSDSRTCTLLGLTEEDMALINALLEDFVGRKLGVTAFREGQPVSFLRGDIVLMIGDIHPTTTASSDSSAAVPVSLSR